MALAPRFTGVPALPQADIPEWQTQFLGAVKENLELLINARNEPDRASTALTRSTVTTGTPPTQNMTRVSASSAGVVISGQSVPTLADYTGLVTDVQTLANDVAALRTTVEALIAQLKG